jgi:hypothetical protein
MRLASFTVGELVITILRVPTNVRVVGQFEISRS